MIDRNSLQRLIYLKTCEGVVVLRPVFNRRQTFALGFGFLMLLVIGLMASWVDEFAGGREVLLGAWAPIWRPPSRTAVVDLLRLALEGSFVVGVTGLSVWMLRD